MTNGDSIIKTFKTAQEKYPELQPIVELLEGPHGMQIFCSFMSVVSWLYAFQPGFRETLESNVRDTMVARAERKAREKEEALNCPEVKMVY